MVRTKQLGCRSMRERSLTIGPEVNTNQRSSSIEAVHFSDQHTLTTYTGHAPSTAVTTVHSGFFTGSSNLSPVLLLAASVVVARSHRSRAAMSSSSLLSWPVYPPDSYPQERRRIEQAFAIFDRDNKKVVLKESVAHITHSSQPTVHHKRLLSVTSANSKP